MAFSSLVILLLISGLVSPAPFQEQHLSQPVDHFGFGKANQIYFDQRYFIDDSYWVAKRVNNPILVFLGGEAPMEYYLQDMGILNIAAAHFRARIIYIEHRFYEKSVPFESLGLAMLDTEVRGCFTSEQALADFAEVIQVVNKNFSPVIVMGCSYAGMLAAWFRLKFPHLATAALASSAPIMNSEDLAPEDHYCFIVGRDFKDTSEKCYENIKRSWQMLDVTASQPNGLGILAQIFKTCSPLFSVEQLKSYLTQVYKYAAQYNGRINGMVDTLCEEITKASDETILGAITRGVLSMTGSPTCMDIPFMADATTLFPLDSNSSRAWDWQVCSELVSLTDCSNNTMFVADSSNLTTHMESCLQKYGVYPHYNWVSTYYGGQEVKSALKDFGSNIIFSNGLKDPLSGAGVLQDISDTIVTITTKQGSHCLDFNPAHHNDPEWLKRQRFEELKVLSHWIKNAQSSSNSFNMMATNVLALFGVFMYQVM